MKKKPLVILSLLILFFLVLGLVLYWPIIFQEGNPLPIVQGIVRLQLSEEKIIAIDSERYLTKTEDSNEAIISFMESKGWVFKDRLGSGYVFEKQENLLTIVGRQYSRFFRIFNIPELE
ncbi:MAG: hypothetical protein GXW85_02835 [Clostridia bacterium]|nr:hypothetical protein [Clostridia bacterium]